MNFRNKLVSSLALCSAAIGCDPLAGEDYTGEVLLSLEGQVVNVNDTNRDLRPVLAFWTPEGFRLVDPEVEGVFPSDFRLRVMEAPPQDVMVGGFASAVVLLMPADHPDSIRVARPELDTGNCDPDGNDHCQRTETLCIDGECVERDFSCTVDPCDIIETTGEEPVDIDDTYISIEQRQCAGDSCVEAKRYCAEDTGCYTELRACVGLEVSAFAEGQPSECSIVAERGNPELLDMKGPDLAISNLSLIYLTEVPEGDPAYGPPLGELRAGYNVVQPVEVGPEALAAAARCELHAWDTALDDYNESNGTEYQLSDVLPDEVSEEVFDLRLLAEAWCSTLAQHSVNVLSDPETTSLLIELGPPPKLRE